MQAIAYLLSPVFFMICDHLIIDQTAFTTIDKQGCTFTGSWSVDHILNVNACKTIISDMLTHDHPHA